MKFKIGDVVILQSDDKYNGTISSIIGLQDDDYRYVLNTERGQYGATEDQLTLDTKLARLLLGIDT